MKKLAIISTHPIQYYAPVFKLLSERKNLIVKVFYTLGKDSITKYDPGFGKIIEWDIPLLQGYDYEFLTNISKRQGTQYFRGIINTDAIQKIESFNPDVILIYGWKYQSHLRIIRYFKNRTTLLFRGDSHLLDTISFKRRILRKLFLQWVYSKIDKALYVGSANKAYFLAHGLKREQLFFAPHAVDNDRFGNVTLDNSNKLRLKLGLTENDVLVLFVGKMNELKNPLVLLRAFEVVKAKNMHLLYVGRGELEDILKLEVKSKNISNVYFTGFINQSSLPAYYHASDVFCLPSKTETWGLTVNEAMASGNAIIVSDKVGCGADLVIDGENGFIFKDNEIESLATALRNFTSRDKALKFSARSKQIIYNWSFTTQVACIESILNNG